MQFLEIKKIYLLCKINIYLAHCISSDYELGAGIVQQFQKRFHLKSKLNKIGNHIYPDCIRIGRIFNLVTKNKYYNKPTYTSLKSSLLIMKEFIIKQNVKYLAMPKIGSRLDKLQWCKVREIIKDVFKDIDIEILICYI